jgi:hypothetical protein
MYSHCEDVSPNLFAFNVILTKDGLIFSSGPENARFVVMPGVIEFG